MSGGIALSTDEYDQIKSVTNNFTGNWVAGYNVLNQIIAAHPGVLDTASAYWYQNAPLFNGNDKSSQANVYIRAVTAAGLQFDGKLPTDPYQQASLLQNASDSIAQQVFFGIRDNSVIGTANIIIPQDISSAFQSAGITIGG